MYAQVTTVEASPSRLDTAIRFFREQILPQLQQMDGFKGFVALADPQRGKLLGVAVWQTWWDPPPPRRSGSERGELRSLHP
jgi:hypothetical protein